MDDLGWDLSEQVTTRAKRMRKKDRQPHRVGERSCRQRASPGSLKEDN